MREKPSSQLSSSKTALVIGSSGNIGFAATQFLIDSGVNVVAADYDDAANKEALSKLEASGEHQAQPVTFAQIDASDIDAISALINDHQPDVVISALPPGRLAFLRVRKKRRHMLVLIF